MNPVDRLQRAASAAWDVAGYPDDRHVLNAAIDAFAACGIDYVKALTLVAFRDGLRIQDAATKVAIATSNGVARLRTLEG